MLSISQFAKAGGVGVETVRYYQRQGLLETPPQRGGMRRYNEQDQRRLRFIRKAQAAGFRLQEIKELIALDSSQDRHRARTLAQARLAELEQKISDLQEARDALQRLAVECGKGAPGPCPILESFGV